MNSTAPIDQASLFPSQAVDSTAPRAMEGQCPVCGDTQLQWLFTKKGRNFWRCGTCRVEKQHPLPSRAELKAYYDAAYTEGMYEVFTAAEEMKTMTARRRLQEILPHLSREGRWLDVGCANGVFLREAGTLGIQASGVELSDVAVAKALAAGLDVQCGALEDIDPAAQYNVITAFDVLEHVLDPSGFLASMVERLAPGGQIALTLPNRDSIFCRLMGARWWFYIPEEHLHYFQPKNVRALCEHAGLEVLHVGRTYKPLTFDYGLTQFVEYNPLIYRVMKMAAVFLPRALRQWILPFYIGEMKVIARKKA
ncbi:MAG: class I SAM-dependent methyltransferase [Verrucomicrobiales bacterium]|nr:class I SAM-dependent methyltransferase [Akkermansiaceae bacterium]